MRQPLLWLDALRQTPFDFTKPYVIFYLYINFLRRRDFHLSPKRLVCHNAIIRAPRIISDTAFFLITASYIGVFDLLLFKNVKSRYFFTMEHEAMRNKSRVPSSINDTKQRKYHSHLDVAYNKTYDPNNCGDDPDENGNQPFVYKDFFFHRLAPPFLSDRIFNFLSFSYQIRGSAFPEKTARPRRPPRASQTH